jgi:hypothetical protein
MKRMFLLLSIFWICCISGCGNFTTETGGASETVNATVIIRDSSIIVKIKAEDTVFANVRLFEANYNPLKSDGYTDSAVVASGEEGIKLTVANGEYNCIISDRNSAKSLLVSGLEVGAGSSDTISDTLSVCGSIEGNVPLDQFDSLKLSPAKVFLLGTNFLTEVDTLGVFNLNSIPAGSYSIVATLENNKTKDNKVPDRTVGRKVEVKKGEALTGMILYFSN